MKKTRPEIDRLVNDIKLHRYLYYNKTPRISDQAYDGLVERLKQLSPDHEVLAEVGSAPAQDSGWQKAIHTMRMTSLQNAMSILEFEKWVSSIHAVGKVCVLEDKFDGASLSIIYENGELVQGITRGNGKVGDDITVNVKKMKFIPQSIPEKINASIRGEVMLMTKDFEALNTQGENYSNARNAANGIAKRFDGKYSDSLCLIVYDIESSDITFGYETEKMDYLSNTLGFTTANYKLVTVQEVIQIRQRYMDTDRVKLPYNIDGLVVKLNNIAKQKEAGLCSNGDPKAQIAFKFDARGVATTLNNIELTVGRTGIITPNAVIEPVNIDGSMVKAASIHNFDEIERLGVGVGDTILVIKAGEIIPKIKEVIKSAGHPFKVPTECPICHGPVSKMKKDDGSDGVYLICDSDNCAGKEFRKIRHWLDVLKKRLSMDGLGESTIMQMFEKDLIKDPADFYTLTVDKIADLDRMGDKSAKKIVDGLQRCKEMDLVSFLCALAIPCLGETMAELITEEYDLYGLMDEATEADLAKISGIGSSRAKDIVEGLESRRPLIEKLMTLGVTIRKPQAIVLQSVKLQGKSFQVTGAFTRVNTKTNKSYNRDEWYELVQAHGGTISRVNNDLNYLVGIKTSSNKIAKAQKFGTTIISEDQFWEMLE